MRSGREELNIWKRVRTEKDRTLQALSIGCYDEENREVVIECDTSIEEAYTLCWSYS